jgi:5-methylcytosine-specific restriction protein B
MINRSIDTILSSGLLFTEQFITRFVISLMTKPFVILSGLSGSGKTQLAIAFAKAICADFKKQVRIVPVGADWTNREPLLGYPNALNEGEYVQPDSNVLQLIIDANKDEKHPYFLILDEMNLSYVERYFADFLSAIESKEEIPLWQHPKGNTKEAIPEAVALPQNLYIIGTINVDETTYMFSPKVLDRANVLEFKMDLIDLEKYLNASSDVDLEIVKGGLASYAESFVKYSREKVTSGFSASKDTLLAFFKELKAVNSEFGYRSAAEIGRFISLAMAIGGMKAEEAIDAAIVQKLLPKLHGSQKRLTPVLKALWKLCNTGVELNYDSTIPDKTVYKLSADKLLRMYKCANENGFTSFAEA